MNEAGVVGPPAWPGLPGGAAMNPSGAEVLPELVEIHRYGLEKTQHKQNLCLPQRRLYDAKDYTFGPGTDGDVRCTFNGR